MDLGGAVRDTIRRRISESSPDTSPTLPNTTSHHDPDNFSIVPRQSVSSNPLEISNIRSNIPSSRMVSSPIADTGSLGGRFSKAGKLHDPTLAHKRRTVLPVAVPILVSDIESLVVMTRDGLLMNAFRHLAQIIEAQDVRAPTIRHTFTALDFFI